jgi:hypothetical protein
LLSFENPPRTTTIDVEPGVLDDPHQFSVAPSIGLNSVWYMIGLLRVSSRSIDYTASEWSNGVVSNIPYVFLNIW